MKILMLSSHFNLPGDKVPIGGVQRHISGITDSLRKMFHIVDWNYPSLIKNEIIESEYDVCIAHDFPCFRDGLKIPQIIVFHGWEGAWPVNPNIKKRRIEISHKADGVINIGDSIVRMYESKPGLVLYGGYDPAQFINYDYNQQIKDKMVVVARIERDSTLIPSVDLAKKMNLEFEICGDGKSEIKQEIKALYDRTVFHGFVKNPNEYLSDAKYFVIGGYLAMIEAMCLKKIVVAFHQNGGRKFRVEDIPPEVTIFSGCSSAEVFEKLEKNKDCMADIVESNYRWAIRQTWAKVSSQYLQLIREIMR